MYKSIKDDLGFKVAAFGTILILFWVGLYKFTATEAYAIIPLVKNHFATFWLYDIFSIQMVSNLIGSFEVIIACGVIIGFKYRKIARLSSIGLIVMFITTLSFLFTTPGSFTIINGLPGYKYFSHTDFFILKDIMYLAFGITLFQKSKE